MAIRVAVNGFGRIGRLVFRGLLARADEFEIVAVNDITDNRTLATLLKYDSSHRRLSATVEYDDENLIVGGKKIMALAECDPAKLPWGEQDVDVVVESTGIFRTHAIDNESGYKPGYDTHVVKAGAKKVVLSAPASDKPCLTVVMGVNDDQLTPEMKYISNASCTTNCLAPVAKVLHREFGIEKGLMTTIHSYTNDQRLLDFPHKDLYRARAAAVNIIPTKTGAAKAIGLVIPDLDGKLNGMAMRVPTPTGSVVDLVVKLKKTVTKRDVNAAMKEAAEGPMKGILCYTEDPIVSSDVIGDSHSSIFAGDLTQTRKKGGDDLVKVVSWYDNEWGYSCRTVDLIAKIGAM